MGRATRGRWLLYQASIGSPVYDILAARSEPKLVNYHNITPASLLRAWEPNVAYEVSLGREQLARLAPQSRFAVADSAFNESELVALGYKGTAVVPLLIDMQSKSDEPDPALLERLMAAKERSGGADLLYVGKISPHKAPHDLVKMLDVLRRTYDPAARLHLIGSPLGETYEPALRAFISELGLDDAVNLPGSVTGAELEAYFRAADVFVMASDHEGFCVPLAEAMGHGVPIVAYGVTAVPETVGDAGLVLPTSPPCRSPPRWAGSWGIRSCGRCWRRPAWRGPPGSTWGPRRSVSCRWSRRPSQAEDGAGAALLGQVGSVVSEPAARAGRPPDRRRWADRAT